MFGLQANKLELNHSLRQLLTFLVPNNRQLPLRAQRGSLPILTFTGHAVQAIKYYLSRFENSRLLSLQHYSSKEPGGAGRMRIAESVLCGQRFQPWTV